MPWNHKEYWIFCDESVQDALCFGYGSPFTEDPPPWSLLSTVRQSLLDVMRTQYNWLLDTELVPLGDDGCEINLDVEFEFDLDRQSSNSTGVTFVDFHRALFSVEEDLAAIDHR